MVHRPDNKTKPNKLIHPAIILACIPAVAVLVTIVIPSTQIYLYYFLPSGILASVLARIALHQLKSGSGTPRERNLALVAYFLGLAPVLYFLAVLTYQLFHL